MELSACLKVSSKFVVITYSGTGIQLAQNQHNTHSHTPSIQVVTANWRIEKHLRMPFLATISRWTGNLNVMGWLTHWRTRPCWTTDAHYCLCRSVWGPMYFQQYTIHLFPKSYIDSIDTKHNNPRSTVLSINSYLLICSEIPVASASMVYFQTGQHASHFVARTVESQWRSGLLKKFNWVLIFFNTVLYPSAKSEASSQVNRRPSPCFL
jgi:hypothetical protein